MPDNTTRPVKMTTELWGWKRSMDRTLYKTSIQIVNKGSSIMPFDVEPQSKLLDPLSYTKEEAEAMIGIKVVGRFSPDDYVVVDGHRGEVVSTERVVDFGDTFHHKVGVQWKDREGNTSKPELMTKEELDSHTRRLSLAERIAENRAAARQSKHACVTCSQSRLKR